MAASEAINAPIATAAVSAASLVPTCNAADPSRWLEKPENVVAENQCAKIMTGAVVPEGADCVIMVEYTEEVSKGKIRFTGKTTNDNICLKGEDIRIGQTVLRASARLRAASSFRPRERSTTPSRV